MDKFTAVGIVEGYIDCDTDEIYIEALQLLIDSGLAWRLQGFFGRVAIMAIQRGDCSPPAGYVLNANGKLESAEAND